MSKMEIMEQIPNKIKRKYARTVTLVQEWALSVGLANDLHGLYSKKEDSFDCLRCLCD